MILIKSGFVELIESEDEGTDQHWQMIMLKRFKAANLIRMSISHNT